MSANPFLPMPVSQPADAARPPAEQGDADPVAYEWLRLGVRAAAEGNREDARYYFVQAVRTDLSYAQAWLYLGGVADDPALTLSCMQKVLQLQPDDPQAWKGLIWAREKLGLLPPPLPIGPPGLGPAARLGNGVPGHASLAMPGTASPAGQAHVIVPGPPAETAPGGRPSRAVTRPLTPLSERRPGTPPGSVPIARPPRGSTGTLAAPDPAPQGHGTGRSRTTRPLEAPPVPARAVPATLAPAVPAGAPRAIATPSGVPSPELLRSLSAQLVRRGVEAARANNRPWARYLFMQALAFDTTNIRGWLYLGGAAGDPAITLACMERVLLNDPDNPQAHIGAAWAREQLGLSGIPLIDWG